MVSKLTTNRTIRTHWEQQDSLTGLAVLVFSFHTISDYKSTLTWENMMH